MMPYIDLSFYATHVGEPFLDYVSTRPAEFFGAEFRASKLVDRYTQNRVRSMAEVPRAVKMLMAELVSLELKQGANALNHQTVSSFSNDGYSETYAEPLTTERIQALEHQLILTYLSEEVDDNGVPLLYLGVD